MRKSSYSLKLLLICSMMCALSIVLGKYLAFNLGPFIRVSGENLPILFSGIAFGPLAGMAVGTVADLVGCVLVGYEINPLVTLGAAAVGLLSGLAGRLTKGMKPLLSTVTSVGIAHLVGSVLIKTAGLALYYGMPFFLTMGYRAVNYLLVGGVECFILFFLLSNPAIRSSIRRLRPIRHSGTEEPRDGDAVSDKTAEE